METMTLAETFYSGETKPRLAALFLSLVALINLILFIDLTKTFLRVRNGVRYQDDTIEKILDKKGFLARMLRPLFRIVRASWHMYFVGLLFGLGFDTASEIALLGISADTASMGISIWSVMVFPLLFLSGMCLVDTTDGVLMIGAYGWAFVNPSRKLYYNMTITFFSFIIAFLIGGVEALGLVAEKLRLDGWGWRQVESVGDHFSYLGYAIIAIMAALWLVSTLFYKALNRPGHPLVNDGNQNCCH